MNHFIALLKALPPAGELNFFANPYIPFSARVGRNGRWGYTAPNRLEIG